MLGDVTSSGKRAATLNTFTLERLMDFARRRPVAVAMSLFALALTMRLAIILLSGKFRIVEHTEVVNVAIALAERGEFADAYGKGTGATAHVSPVYPALLSVIFRVFGVPGTSDLAQEVFSASIASIQYALLPSAALALGLPWSTGLAAAIAGAVMPLNFWAENKGSFEAALSGLALMILCSQTAKTWRSGDLSLKTGAINETLSGVAILIHAALLNVVAALAVMPVLLQRGALWLRIRYAAVIMSLSLLLISPWISRNWRVLGSPMLRSNFGLELRISNSDGASADYQENGRSGHLFSMHPQTSGVEHARVLQVGEAQYNRENLEKAFTWIRHHGREFAALTARRMYLFWFQTMVRRSQMILYRTVSLLGLLGLFWLAIARHPAAVLLSAVLVSYSIVFYFVQAFGRYRYPIDWAILLLAATFVMGVAPRAMKVRRRAANA